MSEQTLCITPGDPMGIGPEITVKLLHAHHKEFPDQTFRIIGSLPALEHSAQRLNLPLPQSHQIEYENIEGETPGEVAYQSIERAIEVIAQGKAKALVTGPIHKKNLQDAGILASGHTEILELLARRFYPAQKYKAEMLFVFQNLRMLLLTRHIPLSHVSSEITLDHAMAALETLHHFLTAQAGITTPHIAVLGVNPHAGEVGGAEEERVLIPLIKRLNQTRKVAIEGPFAADAFFRDFNLQQFPYDAIVSAYHDQGLIPFKLIAGYQAVNVTIGLPFIRTSVGHGTAFDIAGRGVAKEEGLIAATHCAIQLINSKVLMPHLH